MQHAGLSGHGVSHLAGGEVLCGVAQEGEHGQARVLNLLQLVLLILRRAARTAMASEKAQQETDSDAALRSA